MQSRSAGPGGALLLLEQAQQQQGQQQLALKQRGRPPPPGPEQPLLTWQRQRPQRRPSLRPRGGCCATSASEQPPPEWWCCGRPYGPRGGTAASAVAAACSLQLPPLRPQCRAAAGGGGNALRPPLEARMRSARLRCRWRRLQGRQPPGQGGRGRARGCPSRRGRCGTQRATAQGRGSGPGQRFEAEECGGAHRCGCPPLSHLRVLPDPALDVCGVVGPLRWGMGGQQAR